MSARSRMTMRALVERNSAAAVGDFGEELPPTWETLHDALPCWLYTPRGREMVRGVDTNSPGTGIVVSESPAMLIPMGTDINERDRVNGVKDRSGNIYRDGIFRIASVVEVHDHLEVALEAVS